ncbi:MAG: DeoR/GlpR family DNA-binding transcription regulator [Deinococcales bacterium]
MPDKLMTMLEESSRLLPSERLQRIRQLLNERGLVRVSELAHILDVSEMTIRRDLNELEKTGSIEKTFGAAILVEQAAAESSYKVRLKTQQAEKLAIARYAASFVQDGDTIAIDASTTGLTLAQQLSQRQITIVTNSLDIAQTLRGMQPALILTGGLLREKAGSFVGPLALHSLHDVRVDRVFFSAKGVLIPDGFLDSDLSEVEVKRMMLNHAARATALIDSSKFGKRAMGLIASLNEVDELITDNQISEAQHKSLITLGINVHIAAVEGTLKASNKSS